MKRARKGVRAVWGGGQRAQEWIMGSSNFQMTKI